MERAKMGNRWQDHAFVDVAGTWGMTPAGGRRI